MFITEIKKQGVKILELNGRFDGSDTHIVSELNDLIEKQDKILIDCKDMTYINSLGLRVFLSTLKTASAANQRIIVSSLTEPVYEVFRISGFLDLFEFVQNKEEGLEKFATI
jgi:anti-anti-sigma factor